MAELFTAEERALLESSPYVKRAGETQLTYEKEYYYQLFLLMQDGFEFEEALENVGTPISILGESRAQALKYRTLKYAKERKQFGKSISTFQINAFKLADMDVEIEAARNLLYKAAWLCDEKRKEYKRYAAMAKLYCGEVAYRCVNHAVQIHGAYGLMKEYDVERFYRDQKLLDIGEGTSEIMRLVISRYIGCYDVD